MVDRGRSLVLFGSAPWEGSWLGSNHLARALASHTQVVYVDPPRVHARSGRDRVKTTVVQDSLLVVSPLAPPGKDRRPVHHLTTTMMRRQVRNALRRRSINVEAVISGQPKYNPFGALGEDLRIFRVSDDFPASSIYTGVPRRRIEHAVNRLASLSDVICCSSPVLEDHWRARGYTTLMIPNGCDAPLLATSVTASPSGELAALPHPVVGFVGHLSNRVDLDLLHGCVERGWTLLLVGKRQPSFSEAALRQLTSAPNVHWLPDRPFDALPEVFAAIDVGIVPYTNAEFNRSAFPLKLLEYLGAGLRVVSTDLPAARWLNTDLIRIATSPRDFLDAVEGTLSSSQSERELSERLAFAAQHSWDARAWQYLDVIRARTDRPSLLEH